MSRNWLPCVAASVVLHGGAAAMFFTASSGSASAPVAAERIIQVELMAAPASFAPRGAAASASSSAAPTQGALSETRVQSKTDGAAAQTDKVSFVRTGDAAAATAPDPGAVSDYYQLVQAHLTRYHAYPAALTARPVGMVRLGLIVQRDGRIMDAWIENSSGVAALDDAALETLRMADPLPALPKTLPGAIDLVVPLRYEARLKTSR